MLLQGYITNKCNLFTFVSFYIFKAGQEIRDVEQEQRKLLWRAPELLRDPSAPPRGTQKGDVYSFGIILYEMIGRAGPWGRIQFSVPGMCIDWEESNCTGNFANIHYMVCV